MTQNFSRRLKLSRTAIMTAMAVTVAALIALLAAAGGGALTSEDVQVQGPESAISPPALPQGANLLPAIAN